MTSSPCACGVRRRMQRRGSGGRTRATEPRRLPLHPPPPPPARDASTRAASAVGRRRRVVPRYDARAREATARHARAAAAGTLDPNTGRWRPSSTAEAAPGSQSRPSAKALVERRRRQRGGGEGAATPPRRRGAAAAARAPPPPKSLPRVTQVSAASVETAGQRRTPSLCTRLRTCVSLGCVRTSGRRPSPAPPRTRRTTRSPATLCSSLCTSAHRPRAHARRPAESSGDAVPSSDRCRRRRAFGAAAVGEGADAAAAAARRAVRRLRGLLKATGGEARSWARTT